VKIDELKEKRPLLAICLATDRYVFNRVATLWFCWT